MCELRRTADDVTIACGLGAPDAPAGPPPWAGEGPVTVGAYGAYLAHQDDVALAEEWGLLDALGREVTHLGDRLEDWL